MASQVENGLQVSIEEGAAWSRKLVITVPVERVKSARAKITRQLSKRVRVAGFRKGKVPGHIMEARFGTDIDRQTQQALVDDAFREAVSDNELDPISEPRVTSINYDPDTELTFEVWFDVRPRISLTRIGGFRVRRPVVEVGGDDIEERLSMLRRSAALWKPVERRPEPGDNVEVEITNLAQTEDGARPYSFVLGEGRAIQGVETSIMELGPGASGEFTVEFPDDFPDESQRGRSQELRIALKQVLEQELPELDDEFARSLGEFDSLESLREALSEDIERAKERDADAEIDRQLIELVIQSNPSEVPETMVERFIDSLLGPPPEGADPEVVRGARDEARPAAIWGIKRTLILQKIADDQEFEATPSDVDRRVQAIAERAGRSAKEIRARLTKSGELSELRRRIVDEKVFEYLREQSEIEDGEG